MRNCSNYGLPGFAIDLLEKNIRRELTPELTPNLNTELNFFSSDSLSRSDNSRRISDWLRLQR